ncbi:Multifunctional methyltransferase subunit trm112 [Golovinomyces cichoracearum]|uniref:Multifunctional methyltransferase subunit trm112 n=1 Tax=Golovinomyces cichoracearum TaxID=62708 RepID=A0A420IQ24_9PEZI|nr:Multifunctional methyltransferase subunit trm112 [Golovinomyces cichoracearum]
MGRSSELRIFGEYQIFLGSGQDQLRDYFSTGPVHLHFPSTIKKLKMKVLTLNFLQCAVKSCKSSSASFPLHPKDCELVNDSVAPNLKLLQNILPRIDWKALGITAIEIILGKTSMGSKLVLIFEANYQLPPQLGFSMKLPENPPTAIQLEADSQMQRDLHILLIETQVSEGALVCGNCGHEYKIREGIANFLLPNHLV